VFLGVYFSSSYLSAQDLAIAVTDADKAEGNAGNIAFTFTVTRTAPLTGTSSATWTVTGNGADPATADDFDGGVFPTEPVNFAIGVATQTITINVSGDTAFEPNEGFTVTLSASVDATITTATANGTIQNDDALPTLAITATDADKAEGNAGHTLFTFTVSRSGDLTGASSATYTVTGSGSNAADFQGGTLPVGTVTFAATEASQVITINVLGDAIVEPNEGFTVTLSVAIGATITTAAADGVIQNDDSFPTLAIAATDADKPEGDTGPTPFTFTVTRTGNLAGASTVSWAVIGSGANAAIATDFTGGAFPGATLTFSTGVATQIITVNVNGDLNIELDNGFTVTLSAPFDATITTATALGNIQNDDSPPTLSISATNANQPEGDAGNTPFTFTVVRDGNLTAVTTVNWAVTGSGTNPANNADFAGPTFPAGTLTFAIGVATQTITVNVSGDTTTEPNEGFTVTLSTVMGASITTTTAIGTIQDDDASPDIFLVAEGVTATNDLDGNPNTNQQSLVINTLTKDIVFTALPLNGVTNYRFQWSGFGGTTITNIVNGDMINGVAAIINNNTLKIRAALQDRVFVGVTINGTEVTTDNILISDSPFDNLPSRVCVDVGAINFSIGDNTWADIDNTRPAPEPTETRATFKRIQFDNGTLISTTRGGAINTTTLGEGVYNIQVIVDFQIYFAFFGFPIILNDIVWISQNIEIGRPTPSMISPNLTTTYCVNNPVIVNLSNFAEPAGGVFRLNGSVVTELRPTLLTPQDYTLVYEYENTFDCISTDTKTITINPIPSTDFDFINTCFGETTEFTAIDNSPNLAYNWTINNAPFSIEQNPVISFGSPGLYQVRLTVTNTLTQCSVDNERAVLIHALPISTFTFNNICDLTPNFINTSAMQASNPTMNMINDVIWRFGDGTEVTIPFSTNSGNTSHTYPDFGSYQVELVINTINGCSTSITKTINIFPSITLDAVNNSYVENFDNGDENWISGGINSSWQRILPPNNNIQNTLGTNEVWITQNATNTYNTNEKSYIESPCFDISALPNPMINLKIWTDTDLSGDGALLLYTIDNSENSEWKVVSLKTGVSPNVISQKGGGVEWYNQENLLGSPTTEIGIIDNPLKVGWSGKDIGWKIAKFPLDDVQKDAVQNGNGVVRFRIAFGSNADNPANATFDGFAVDTVLITERDRLTLVEHFTNTQSITNAASEEELNEILGLDDSQKTLIIRYLTSFPISDPNITILRNIADNSARALYYNIASLTRTLIDGGNPFQKNPQDFTAATGYWDEFKAAQTQRILSQPSIRISTLLLNPANGQSALRLQFDLSQNLSALPILNPFLVQICLTERQLPAPFEDFRNIAREFIPSLSGATRLTWDDLNAGFPINLTWEPPQDITPNDFKIVVFIQDEVTKEIYQAQEANIPFLVDAPGGRENQADVGTTNPALSEFDFTVYPNPSNSDCNIWFSTAQQKAQEWILRDSYGKVIATGEAPAETQLMKLRVSDFASGLYTLQIGKVMKKIVVE